ncbi:PAS domain-containing protein [Natrialba sp. INN-245]|nr:PAS domain-containing protein [Natrialba sp. INN-245]
MGYEPEEMIGEPFTTFNTERSAERALAAFESILEGDDIDAVELELTTATGDTVVLEVNGTPETEDGEIVGVHGVGRDITQQKKSQRELELKNKAIDEAHVGITIADAQQPENPIVYANRGFEQITGYDPADVTGRSYRFLQGEQTDPTAVTKLRESIEACEPTVVELVNYRKDGVPFWNEVRVAPVKNEAGVVTHFLGIQNDVTGRRRQEHLVRVLNRVLRHNLRNDMQVITGLSHLLETDDDTTPAEIGSDIRNVGEESIELGERARELEDAASRDVKPSRLDPDSLLTEIASRYREQFPRVVIDTDVRTEKDICAGSEITGAVSELVENAVKHNTSREPRVEIELVDDGEWIVLSVEDNGPGIDEMEANVISHGEERDLEHGSGLGLWLVNWCVTRYGGSFDVHPKSGTGSCATIRLPAIEADQTVADASKRPTVLFW